VRGASPLVSSAGTRSGFHRLGVLAGLAGLLAGGCASIDYYAQSVAGQVSILAARRPFEVLLVDAGTPDTLRSRVEYVRSVRQFAADDLALPDNGSYRTYVDIGRRYVAWSVVATPELSLVPRTWCFPVAGCVAYRGYFDEPAAARFAEDLRADGDDVHVAGVAAYSTLGWFDDPLPSNVVDWPDAELAGLIFHELAHQVVYVRDDTAFNEAFAVTVEEEGVRRWLAGRTDPEGLAAYERTRADRAAFLGLVFAARARLADLYGSDLAPESMRLAKAAIFSDLHAACEDQETRSGGRSRYRVWCAETPNNARLAALATYHDLAPAFRSLLARKGGDLPTFYANVRTLAEMPGEERRQHLAEVLAADTQ